MLYVPSLGLLWDWIAKKDDAIKYLKQITAGVPGESGLNLPAVADMLKAFPGADVVAIRPKAQPKKDVPQKTTLKSGDEIEQDAVLHDAFLAASEFEQLEY